MKAGDEEVGAEALLLLGEHLTAFLTRVTASPRVPLTSARAVEADAPVPDSPYLLGQVPRSRSSAMTSATAWRPALWTRRPALGSSCWDTSW